MVNCMGKRVSLQKNYVQRQQRHQRAASVIQSAPATSQPTAAADPTPSQAGIDLDRQADGGASLARSNQL